MYTEQINKKDIWNPCFYKHFPGFSCILPLWKQQAAYFPYSWPQVEDYNVIAKEQRNRISFIAQHSEARYEWEIYHRRRVMTRECSWHDFFNNLTWLSFPKLKWAIVKKVCEEFPSETVKVRNSRQNLLAHFDECGMVICSDKSSIFDDIKAFRWKKLFFETPFLQQHCLPVLMGHGMLEKALNPYIGMTAKAILLQVPSDFFALSGMAQLKYVDEEIANFIQSPEFPNSPQALQPFPILGWPTWHQENQQECFYENTNYFRTQRMLKEPVDLMVLSGKEIF